MGWLESDAGKTAGTLLSLLVLLGVVAMMAHDAIRDMRGRERLEKVLAVRGDQGVILALYQDHLTGGEWGVTNHYHVVSYDLATSKRRGDLKLVTVKHDRTHDLYPAAAGLGWFRGPDHKLQLIDLTAPRRVLDSSQLAAKVPELAEGYEVRDLDRQGLVKVVLHDGRRGWLDAKPSFHTSWQGLARAWSPMPAGSACLQGQLATVPGSVALSLVGIGAPPTGAGVRAYPRPALTVKGTPPAGATPLFDPVVIPYFHSPCAAVVRGDLLVIHDSAAVKPYKQLLSMVDAAGHALWSEPLDRMFHHSRAEVGAIVVDDTIYLVAEPGHRSSHVDFMELAALSTTGEVLAHHELL